MSCKEGEHLTKILNTHMSENFHFPKRTKTKSILLLLNEAEI